MSMNKRKKIAVWKPKNLVVERPKKIETEKRVENKKEYDHKWRAYSIAYRKSNPFCVECLKEGIYNSDNIHVDHIIPITENPELKYEESNHQSLCV
ncbi:HNH endonuclease [Acetobacter tropicalis]|uniref:HNH endonuclease n=1 Tax=Acetobacter tropicalis TaxID=104102 RepID=UPI0006832051|nr:HNH endonuclease [Acetobacter tropicalis]